MKYEALMEPIRIGSLTVKNRIAAAPSLPLLANPDGSATRELIDYYRAKAKGGAGIVTVGESAVDNAYAVTHAAQLNIGSDMMIPSLSLVAEAIKRYGAAASLELCHGGRQTLPAMIGGKAPIGPSPLPSRFHEMLAGQPITVEEMSKAMIDEAVEGFASAALRLKRAGFDMVMLHGGHGWLLAQFLSPFSNRRTDEYGGSLANRARFPLEVIRRVREKVGPDMAIDYRMSGDELVPGGLTSDEAAAFAKMIESEVDCIHVSAGMMAEIATVPYFHPPSYLPHGPNVHLAEKIKKAVSIPVACVGAIMDPELADEIVREGRADMVAMARALMADPELPVKSFGGRRKEVIPCTRCLECLGRVATFLPIRCTVNPVTGRETELSQVGPPERQKRVVVVGGGPAGMETAMVAASRGHTVTLFEKNNGLGGWVRPGCRPWFKQDLHRWLEYMIDRIAALPIDLRLSSEAVRTEVQALSPDVLILAVGADPVVPNLSGADHPSVCWAGDVYNGEAATGKRVLVAGGGLVGCEAALLLARQGAAVTIVEMAADVATQMNPVSRTLLLELLAKEKVEILARTRLEAVFDGGARVMGDNGGRDLAVDNVVLALGLTPRTRVVADLKGLAPETHIIGDCVKPRKIIDAVHEGFNIAMELQYRA